MRVGGLIPRYRPLYRPERDQVAIVQEAGWVLGPVWAGAEKLASLPVFNPRIVQTVACHYID
jgi:hypothetical protein